MADGVEAEVARLRRENAELRQKLARAGGIITGSQRLLRETGSQRLLRETGVPE